jgi:type II secretory pathway component PulK
LVEIKAKRETYAGIPSQQGFVLAATLWVVAIMFVAVGILHGYVQQKLQVGSQAKASLHQRLNSYSTEQTLLYLLSSSRMTRSGMTFSQSRTTELLTEDGLFISDAVGDELTLDGVVYHGIGNTVFSLQDSAGLIALNAPDPLDLAAVLEKYDASASSTTRLISCLKDYIDANELVSLSGAERQDYSRIGLPLPTNDYLRSESELFQVMGWRDWLNARPHVDWQNWFSVRKGSVINLNTMPKTLLMNYLGLSEDLSDKLIVERRTNPFRTVEDFVLRTGFPLNLVEEKYRFFPSSELRISLWNKGGGQAQVISLQLTPNGLYGPWLVNYEYSVQRGNDNNEPLAIRQTTLFGHTLGDDR